MKKMHGVRTNAPIVPILLAAGLLAAEAHAQNYPTKPVRVIVPLSPGGATDITARIIADELGKALSQQFVVENRPGAGGTIGTGLAARAPADGYTLLAGSPTNLSISPQLYPKLKYDARRDLVGISLITRTPNVLVAHPSLPVKGVEDLVALAKKRPGEIFYASSGSGTNVHLTVEMLRAATRIKLVHVPHRGGDGSVMSVVTGEAQLAVQVLPRIAGLVEIGKLRAIAVTSATRSPAMPNVRTVAESGVPGFDVWLWAGMAAPAGLPPAVLERLSSTIGAIAARPEVKARLAGDGSEVVAMGHVEFGKFLANEYARWGKAIQDSGAKLD